MGNQSCVVLLGFIFLHICLVICVVSLATPYWAEGPVANVTESNHTHHGNHSNLLGNSSTGNETDRLQGHVGLWEVCGNDSCTKFEKTDYTLPGWFKTVQGLYCCGTTLIFVALVMDYAFFLVTKLHKSQKFNGAIAFIVAIAVVFFLVVLILFGKNQSEVPSLDSAEVELAWSFYVGVAGCVVAFVGLLLQLREGCLIRGSRGAYEEI